MNESVTTNKASLCSSSSSFSVTNIYSFNELQDYPLAHDHLPRKRRTVLNCWLIGRLVGTYRIGLKRVAVLLQEHFNPLNLKVYMTQMY